MKRDYQLSKLALTIHLSDGNKIFSVRYRLYDHSVANKWVMLMLKSKVLEAVPLEGGNFYGKSFLDFQKTKDALDNNVDIHNDFCRKNGLEDCLIPLKTDTPLTRNSLNKLHECFEIYVEDKRFWVDKRVGLNLEEINYNIHKLESALVESDETCHVDMQFGPVMKVPLADNDYQHFTTNYGWGELLLTYGTIGVPTVNAFFAKSDPTPQRVIPNGMMMIFWGEVKNDHLQMDEWLRSKGMTPNDPKNSVGFIPLGVVENVDSIDRKALISGISKHARVVGYDFSNAAEVVLEDKKPEPKPEPVKVVSPSVISDKQEARWPWDPEIHYHLDHVPYIDLKVEFDAKKLLEEAKKALNYFVPHRDYDQTGKVAGKWKSLALRGLFGDHTKTAYHTTYQFEGKPVYQETAFAQLCPETMKFLSTVTDISKCERIRYMLLEPGASVRVHRDSEDRDVCFAVNISLNMPEGCTFWSHLNRDGSENEFTVTLPFKDSGSVLLFNNAKYHKVVNNSDVPRIHIIFHGPIKFSDEQLIKLAREQNKISDVQELIRKVVRKKAMLGEEFEKNPNLFPDWITTGLRDNSIPENYSLAIFDHNSYAAGEESLLHLRKRTEPSLFPLKFDVIKENMWDEYIKNAYENGKEFVVLMAAGTYVTNLHSFIKNLFYASNDLKKKNWPLAGHIMDFNDGKLLPHLHEQFVIINLKAWNELGQIPLGTLFTSQRDVLKDAEISQEHIHDDYTPLFIKHSESQEGKVVREGELAWGSSLIKKAVEQGRGVLNLPQGLRQEKRYSYPRDNNSKARAEIENIISSRLQFSSNDVYYFNNELLTVLNVPGLKPNRLISVAAGFKPFQAIKQYGFQSGSKIHFTDFSKNSLEHIKTVVKAKNYDELLQIMLASMQKSPHKKSDSEQVNAQLQALIRSYFGSHENLIQAISIAQNATFDEVNLIQNPESLSQLMAPDDQFVIWISNAFYNNSLYLLFTPEECEERVLTLAKSIGKKTSTRVFRHNYKNSQTFIFGDSPRAVRGLLTDGAAQDIPFEDSCWREI